MSGRERQIKLSVKLSACLAACFFATAPMAFTQPLPLEPRHDAGQSITGVFEGWFPNSDGSFSLLFGYYNRNLKEEIDIPIGANNRIEPGGPDRGQPTHFMPGRMWGTFAIRVASDFGTSKVNWTIVANGKTTVIPGNLKADWQLSPFIDAINNTPPLVSFESFDRNGPSVQGPRGLTGSKETLAMETKVGQPLALTVWAADDNVVSPGGRAARAAVAIAWTVFRGPGPVTFSAPKPAVEKVDGKMPPKATFVGKATTTATFSAPGDYTLQVQATDASGEGGGGFQCCWTTAHVKVSVGPASTGGQ